MAAEAYRCVACGNKTRFDVVETKRVRSFHHFTLGGELTIEDEEVLERTVEEIVCRWCGSSSDVVKIGESSRVTDGAPSAWGPSRLPE